MSWLTRMTNTFSTEQLDRELQDELRFHLEERVDELVRRGHTQREAEEEALRHLGNPHRLMESSRDAKLALWLESILQDVRFGMRVLRRDRVPTAAVVLSLSLAIGAATTVFALIDALALRPVPVPHPEQLIFLSYTGPGTGGDARTGENINFSIGQLERLRAAAGPGLGLFGLTYGGPRQTVTFDGDKGPGEPIRPQWISGNGFTVLGLAPSIGRLFNDNDEWPEGEGAAVLSYSYWQQRFGGDPSVVGRRLNFTVRGIPSGTFRIVGVTPKGFHGLEPGAPSDVWFPLSTRIGPGLARLPQAVFFQIRGRAYTPAPPTDALQSAFRQIRQENEKVLLPPGAAVELFRTAQLHIHPAAGTPSYVRAQYENAFWIVAAIVGLVLIVACSNIANFLIARAAAREREMALRAAIGAGRPRLIRQMLIESGLLAAAACVVALALSYFAGPAIVAVLGPSDFPVFLDLRPDGRLLGFLLTTGIAATLLFGLIPAWRASAVTQSSATGYLKPLFAVQIAFGFVVLYLAGLLYGSHRNLETVELGFSPRNVAVWIVATPPGPPNPHQLAAFLAAVRKLPGVEAAGVSTCALAENQTAKAAVFPADGRDPVRIAHAGITQGFLEAMRIPVLRGRDIVDADAEPEQPENVVVSESFAQRIVPGRDPIGARYERQTRQGRISQTIVGVIPDGRYVDVKSPAEPMVFVPNRMLGQATVSIRYRGTADRPAWQAQLAREFPQVVVTSSSDYGRLLSDRGRRERILAWLAGFLAILAVLVVSLGLHGVLGYAVTRRHQEIGLRLAVGGPAPAVAREILSSAARITAAGAVAGAIGSVALTPLVVPLLIGPLPGAARFTLPAASLALAWVATSLPAVIRVVRVNPARTLRFQ